MSTSCSVSELPSYEARPMEVSALAGLTPSSQLQLSEVSSSFTGGRFLQGKVTVLPVADIQSRVLNIYLTCVEQVLDKGKGVCGQALIKQRELRCGETYIMLPQLLERGFSYDFKFSFECTRPRISAKCRCEAGSQGQIHSQALPSVGSILGVNEGLYDVSIRYFVYAKLSDSNSMACKFINWMPTESTFDLGQFKDDFGRLDRVYESGSSVKTGLLKSKYMGTLAVRAAPVIHNWPLQPSETDGKGRLKFSVAFYPSKDSEPVGKLNLSASYEISRVIVAAPHGMRGRLDDKSYSTTKVKTASGSIDLSQSVWNENVLEVISEYEIPEQLTRTPTYSSCYSYGGYELKLTVKHSHGKVVLVIPFVVQRGQLPSYIEGSSLPAYSESE